MLRKMSFESVKQKFLAMSYAEKRAHYKNKEYVEVSSIGKFEIGPQTRQKFPKTCDRVYLWRGDITKLEVDAIVNAANSQLMSGGGVCGSIFNAAGRSDLQAECDSLGGCETGGAVITGGYRLPAKYVIHAVGPMGEKPQQLQDTYKSVLKLCEEKNISSVAIPCISTGIYGYPPDRAGVVAVNTVLENLPSNVNLICLAYGGTMYPLYLLGTRLQYLQQFVETVKREMVGEMTEYTEVAYYLIQLLYLPIFL